MIRSHALPPGALEAARDGWLAPGIPILVRGEAKILPLAWWGDAAVYNPYAEPAHIAAFASHVQGAALHRAGPWTLLDLSADRPDGIGSYTAALRGAGATRVECWVYSSAIGVALVWAGAQDTCDASLAVHVIPAGWVSERHAGPSAAGIDVRWSWAEVVALDSDAAGREEDGEHGRR